MVSRTIRTPFGDWWWTVDRAVLAALVGLMLGGIILSLAASPPVAARLNLDPFHFVNRHVLFLVAGVAVLLACRSCRRGRSGALALVVFVISLAAGRGDAVLRRRDQGRAALARRSSASTSSPRNSSSPLSSS